MQVSEKSHSFMQKLLKHYPVPTQPHKCEHSGAECHSHPPSQTQFQPFQHMHDHRKQREIYDKPTAEKLQNMKYFKQKGNASFKQSKYDEAAYFYNKCILYSDYTFPDKQGDLLTFDILIMQSNMNMAICLIKLKNWNKAIINLRQVLKIEYRDRDEKTKKLMLMSHKKAHYWSTKYYIHDNNLQAAQKQLQLLNKLQSEIESKEEIEELTRQIIESKKIYNKKSLDLSKKMFNNNSNVNEKEIVNGSQNQNDN